MAQAHDFRTPARSSAQIQARAHARSRRKAVALAFTLSALGALAVAAAGALLAPARKLAGKRVIVKRPRHAPWLAGEKPNFVFNGESTRFDGYLP